MKEECQNCRSVSRKERTFSTTYFCRRYPPTLNTINTGLAGGDVITSNFPVIDPKNWCGEYAPQDADADKP